MPPKIKNNCKSHTLLVEMQSIWPPAKQWLTIKFINAIWLFNQENVKTYVHKKTYMWLFIVYNYQNLEIRKCPPTGEWIKKKSWFIFKTEYYSTTKGNELLLHEQHGWISQYAKWKQLDTLVWIVHNLIYITF